MSCVFLGRGVLNCVTVRQVWFALFWYGGCVSLCLGLAGKVSYVYSRSGMLGRGMAGEFR